MADTKRRGSKAAEANVLLEFRAEDVTTDDLLEAVAEEAIEAVFARASEIALGPALAANAEAKTVLLQFDVIASDGAGIQDKVSKVAAVVLEETELGLLRSSVTADLQGEASSSDLAAA
jgi:hypothetical protein